MWAAERAKEPDQFLKALTEPLTPRNPETPTQAVIENEMNAFMALQTETR